MFDRDKNVSMQAIKSTIVLIKFKAIYITIA